MPVPTPSYLSQQFHGKWKEIWAKILEEEYRDNDQLANLLCRISKKDSKTYDLYVSFVAEEVDFRRGIWKSRDGSTRKVEEMSDSHLHNSIQKIKRHMEPGSNERIDYPEWRKKWLPVLERELARRQQLKVEASEIRLRVEYDTMGSWLEPRG